MIQPTQGSGPAASAIGSAKARAAQELCDLLSCPPKAGSAAGEMAQPGSPALSLPGLLLSALAKAQGSSGQPSDSLASLPGQPGAGFADAGQASSPAGRSFAGADGAGEGARAPNNPEPPPGQAFSKAGSIGLPFPDSPGPVPLPDGSAERSRGSPAQEPAGQRAPEGRPAQSARTPASPPGPAPGPMAVQSAASAGKPAALAPRPALFPESPVQSPILGQNQAGADSFEAQASKAAPEPAAAPQAPAQSGPMAFIMRPGEERPAEDGKPRKSYAQACAADEACSVSFRLDFLGSDMDFAVSMDSDKTVRVRLGAKSAKAAGLAAKALLDAGLPPGLLAQGERHGA